MKSILLIGLGRFGRHIAIRLNELGHDVMAVDRNESRINDILPYVTGAQIGDTSSEAFLKSLGVENYDVCIVAIGKDFQSSLETTSYLHEMGAKMVVSRAETDVQEKFLLRNGANEVIYPEKQVAYWSAIRYSSDHILDYVEIDDESGIFEVTIPDEWIGKSVAELDLRKRFNINIIGFKRNEKKNYTVSPDKTMRTDETMLVIGNHKEIQKCFHI